MTEYIIEVNYTHRTHIVAFIQNNLGLPYRVTGKEFNFEGETILIKFKWFRDDIDINHVTKFDDILSVYSYILDRVIKTNEERILYGRDDVHK